jgi:serine protease AprX
MISKTYDGAFFMQRVRQQVEADWELLGDYYDTTGQIPDWTKRPITAAVLDTGVGRHPDLSGKILAFRDFVKGRHIMYDNNGHGTHVCGILCGDGFASDGKYRGIAPGVQLVVGKVLDDNGDGMADNMLKALDWIKEVRTLYGISILNISVGIGSLKQEDKEQALRDRISELWESGMTVVCAAGNKGPEEGSISAVGSCSRVITVGCHDGIYCTNKAGSCANYSGRGYLSSPVRKPDVVAPGTDIVSCNVACHKVYGKFRNAYVEKSGTSMATPIVSGALALLMQKYPGLNNEVIKQRLQYTATDLGEPWNQQGWGMVNIRKMLSMN